MHLSDAETISELESSLAQARGDVIDVCHSAKMILLAYMGYHETNLETYINHINRKAAEYSFKPDRRLDAGAWWESKGCRQDISRWSESQRMQWAYDQGLNA